MPVPANEFSLLRWIRIDFATIDLEVRLYQGIVDPKVPHVLGDFVEANFAGYGPQVLIPQRKAQGDERVGYRISSEMLVFGRTPGPGPENTIGGFYITAKYPDGDRLVGFDAFKTPVNVIPGAYPIGFVVYLHSRNLLV